MLLALLLALPSYPFPGPNLVALRKAGFLDAAEVCVPEARLGRIFALGTCDIDAGDIVVLVSIERDRIGAVGMFSVTGVVPWSIALDPRRPFRSLIEDSLARQPRLYPCDENGASYSTYRGAHSTSSPDEDVVCEEWVLTGRTCAGDFGLIDWMHDEREPKQCRR